MFCPHCGKQMTGTGRFCPHCGGEVTNQAAQNPIPLAQKPARPVKPVQPKKPKDYGKIRSNWIRVLVVSLLIFCITFLGAGGSLVHYFVVGTAEEEAVRALTPPTAQLIADPTYNADEIVKKPVNTSVDLGEEATEEQVTAFTAEVATVKTAIDTAVTTLSATTPSITQENKSQFVRAVSTAMSQLYKNNQISSYKDNGNSLEVVLNSGLVYVYIPQVDGFDSGTDPLMKVATYQPCLEGYDSSLSQYMDYPDQAATGITQTFPMYQFDGSSNYDDATVAVEALLNMAQYHAVFWHGHGGNLPTYGPVLQLGLTPSKENDAKLYGLWKDEYILRSDNAYLVTAQFFREFLDDNSLENTVVYLGACETGANDRLANAFIDRGAAAVYANTQSIHTTYNLSMMKAVAEGLCTPDENGVYMNVSQALEYAKDKEGEQDFGDSDARVVLYADDDTFALDWYEDHMSADREVVLVLDASGSMDGTPLTETKKAALGFVNTVLEQNAVVGVVTYSTSAHKQVDFTRRKTSLTGAINSIYAGSSTSIDAGLTMAQEMLSQSTAKKRIIVLMSDGLPNTGREGDALISFADEIRNEGICIYSLGFFHNLSYESKAGAQTLMEGIADPGCHHEVDTAENIEYVFDDIAAEINGQRRLYIRVACPVEVEVTYNGETLSRDNPRTSFGTISFEATESDDDDETDSDDEVKILRLNEGVDYQVKIEGTDDGSMDYTIGLMDENGEYQDFREFEDIDITEDTIIDTIANYAEATILNVDEDGDGEYDLRYKAQANESGELIEDVTPWQLVVAAVCGCIALPSLLIFILACNRAKNAKKRLAAPAV